MRSIFKNPKFCIREGQPKLFPSGGLLDCSISAKLQLCVGINTLEQGGGGGVQTHPGEVRNDREDRGKGSHQRMRSSII